VLALAALLPLGVLLVVTIVQAQADFFPWGDHAVVQTEVVKSGHGDQLLGTYSRYRWHHPGPALFYFLLAPYYVFGATTGALNAGVVLLNLLAVGTVLFVVARRAGTTAVLWGGVVTGAFVASLGTGLIRDFWIPHAVVLPFAAFIVLCAAFATGRAWALPAAAVVATFLMQTDLSVAGTVGVIGLVALALFIVDLRNGRARGDTPGEGSKWRAWAPFGVAAALVLLMWWPPLHEQVTSDRGNISQVRDFFGEEAPTHSVRETASAVATVMSVLPRGQSLAQGELHADDASKLLFGLQLLLLALGAYVAWQRGRRFAAALCVLALSGVAAEIYAATQIRGPIHGYLVLWFSSVAVPAWIGIGLSLGPELTGYLRRVWPRSARVWRPALAVLLIGLAAYNVVSVAGERSIRDEHAFSAAEVKALSGPVLDYVKANDVKRPEVYIVDPNQWPNAAGVILQLDRASRRPAVTPEWFFMFGKPYEPKGSEDAALLFTSTALGPQGTVLTPAHRRIASAGGTTVYASLGSPRR
jgi:hypothetical protein